MLRNGHSSQSTYRTKTGIFFYSWWETWFSWTLPLGQRMPNKVHWKQDNEAMNFYEYDFCQKHAGIIYFNLITKMTKELHKVTFGSQARGAFWVCHMFWIVQNISMNEVITMWTHTLIRYVCSEYGQVNVFMNIFENIHNRSILSVCHDFSLKMKTYNNSTQKSTTTKGRF